MSNKIKSDVQSQLSSTLRAINWVGMTGIQSFIQESGQSLAAQLDLMVNLKAGHRGIHMSRLYALHMKYLLGREMNLPSAKEFIRLMVESQGDLAQAAKLTYEYRTLLQTRSLKTGLEGFRSYPVKVELTGGRSQIERAVLQFEVIYSSTCPQSAKLSKEFFQNQLTSTQALENWMNSEDIYLATPHAQRSVMLVEVVLNTELLERENPVPAFTESEVGHVNEAFLRSGPWIRIVEETLKTTVQTAVKKEDEMEFARLNAAHAMFCEDAVRGVADVLDTHASLKGYRLTAHHLESLHPHNASSQISFNF